MLEGWWDDGGVTGDKAAKPATADRDVMTISRRGNKKLIGWLEAGSSSATLGF